MKSNPALERLGLPNDARVVIFHADDIGMCQSSLTAYQELLEFGLLSAASVMVPCPWFPALVNFYHEYQEQLAIDMGVHLTLTSEWNSFRWGPLSTRNALSGLLDADGYFYATSEELQANAPVEAVLLEIEAQITQAQAAGIDITHIDSHMGSIFHPQYLDGYLAIANKFRLPALILRLDEAQIQQMPAWKDFPSEASAAYVRQMRSLEEQGYPMIDNVYIMPLERSANRLEHAQEVFDSLPVGITYFIIHPAHDTPELRSIAPDWQARVADYALFTTEAWRDYVNKSGVQVIGYRELAEIYREAYDS